MGWKKSWAAKECFILWAAKELGGKQSFSEHRSNERRSECALIINERERECDLFLWMRAQAGAHRKNEELGSMGALGHQKTETTKKILSWVQWVRWVIKKQRQQKNV